MENTAATPEDIDTTRFAFFTPSGQLYVHADVLEAWEALNMLMPATEAGQTPYAILLRNFLLHENHELFAVQSVLTQKMALTLDNVRINCSDRMEETVGAYPQVTVRREAVQGLLVMSEPPRPPQQRMAGYVAKTPVRVAVLVPTMLIEGTVHVAGKVDAALQVLEGTEGFAVLSEATVTLTSRSSGPIAVPTALVSRAHMELATVRQ